jgi:hypothetical protein
VLHQSRFIGRGLIRHRWQWTLRMRELGVRSHRGVSPVSIVE